MVNAIHWVNALAGVDFVISIALVIAVLKQVGQSDIHTVKRVLLFIAGNRYYT